MPWNLPEVNHATRQEVRRRDGWQVTLQCAGHVGSDVTERAPHYLSYYYQDTPTVFTCVAGQHFLPEQSFSCQGKFLGRAL